MLEIKINDTQTQIVLKSKTKNDCLIDFANAVTGFADAVCKVSGEDIHETFEELGLLILAIAYKDDEDNPFFQEQEVN